MRGAGLRNAVFDSTFFGVEHGIRTTMTTTTTFEASQSSSTAVSFACAAAIAICIDYPIDVAVKRSFARGPHEHVPHGPFMATVHLIRLQQLVLYRGLSCKGMEFATSYCVTGAVAPLVVKGFVTTAALAVTFLS